MIPTLAASFAKLCRQPLPKKPAERNRALADRRAALKKWRDAKNRELDLLKLRAALGVDPSARLEYYVARENEAFRLEAREARKAIDTEKRRVKETPVAEGDALLASTRAIGHVEVESRESFIKRKMAENGWDRKTAIAQSTHLYPEDMEGLGVPPWASKQLYTGAGGHSPDTAAQALYDEGRIADPTVDAFWEAVRGDIETVSLSKQREIEAIEAEAAQAVGRALALHRATLADINQRDAEGGLPLPSDNFRREVTAQGNAGADWTKWNNAEKLRRIRATRVIQIDTPTEGEVVDLLADYRVFAKGYRTRIATWATKGQVAPVNTNAYIGDIRTTKTSIKDTISHGYGPLKVLVIPHLDEILQNAAPYSRGEDTKKELRFINLAHRLTFEGEQLMAFVTVQEDMNGNRTYDVEFGDEKRLSRELPIGAGAGGTAHANPDSLDITSVPQSGADVNPRREVSGLFSGGPVPYDQPSLRAVGSNDGGKVYGWGLYADKVFDVARAFAAGPTAAIHEQRWWTHREPGDESHVLDWELEVTPENRARVLAAVRSLDVTEEELRQIFGRDWATRGMTGEQAYELVVDAVRFFTEADESERTASELLYKHDIDGVHTRDDRSSTYVAFSDEHLQVVRRWIWDAATESFVPDASFLPPTPTPAEAQGRAQAVATVRREATGVLTPRTELALDDLLLRSIVAQEEKRPQDAPFVSGSRIVLPRYDLFFHPDHPNTNSMLFLELRGYQPISMEDIEMGARVLGLDPPLAFEALALQLQHYRDQILKHTTFGERPPHLRGLYRGGPQYVHALPYYGDQTTEDFMQTILRIEQWRDDLLNAAWIYAELGPGVTIREGVRLPGIHLLKPEDRGWRWQEHTLLTPFGKLRLDRKNQRRLTEAESKALANDHFEAPETRTPREIVKTERYISKLIDFAKQHFGARIAYDCNRDGTNIDLFMTYPNGAEFGFHVEGSYALDNATYKLRHELLAALDGRSTARVPTLRERLTRAIGYPELVAFARDALGVQVAYETGVGGRALVLTGPDGAVETIGLSIKEAVGSRLAQHLRDALEKYLPPPTPDELRERIAKARALKPLEQIAADYLGTTVSYETEAESERLVITLTHADGSTTVLDTRLGVAIEELGKALAALIPADATPAPRREVTAAGAHLDANGRTIIQSDKFTIAEAKRSIREQNEKNPNGYTNKATGRIAFINGAQAREMTTESNIKKTTRHGFSVYEHLHAVALAPMLYENAALVRDDPDTKNGDPRVRIMRYASPIVVDRPNGRVEATAWLTVKTSEQHGNRVYSLELLELEEARRITANTASTALPRTRNLTNTIAQPRATVNPQEAFDPADPDIRREVTAAGPHANEPFTYAKSTLQWRVGKAMKEGYGQIKNSARIVISEIPPFWLRFGFERGDLFTIAELLRKIRREHHITARDFADLPAHYAHPVAIFRDGAAWIILTDQLADDGSGRMAPVMLFVRKGKGTADSYLASAYSRDQGGEAEYVRLARSGTTLYLDADRMNALPLLEDTKKALRAVATEKEWAPPLARREGQHAQLKPTEETPSTPAIGQGDNTIIAQPRANVNPQEAFDNARRRLEVAGLYYGRAPEAAELSDRAIAEFAVAEESLRTDEFAAVGLGDRSATGDAGKGRARADTVNRAVQVEGGRRDGATLLGDVHLTLRREGAGDRQVTRQRAPIPAPRDGHTCNRRHTIRHIDGQVLALF